MSVQVYSELPPDLEEGDDSVHVQDHADFQTLATQTRTLMGLSAKKRLSPTEKKHVREALANYGNRSCAFASKWHYAQIRRMTNLGKAAAAGGRIDCSEHMTCSLFMGGKVAHVAVDDPNGLHWSGWGYTGTLLATNDDHQVDGTYLVGDFAIYGTRWNTKHVVTCVKKGNASTAAWTSMGNESGPYLVRLHYRGDLVGAFRPSSLR
jgi:hypothetical protein